MNKNKDLKRLAQHAILLAMEHVEEDLSVTTDADEIEKLTVAMRTLAFAFAEIERR